MDIPEIWVYAGPGCFRDRGLPSATPTTRVDLESGDQEKARRMNRRPLSLSGSLLGLLRSHGAQAAKHVAFDRVPIQHNQFEAFALLFVFFKTSEHRVGDYQALDDVRFLRTRCEAGETAYNDESTAMTMCHVCKTS